MITKNEKKYTFISPVTRDFVRAAWRAQTNVPWDFLHSYVYARWPYLYISIGNGEHPIVKRLKPFLKTLQRLFQRDKPTIKNKSITLSHNRKTGTIADIYHGKVMPLESAQELVMVDEPIDLPDLEQVIPYSRARAIIQQNPDHILLMPCPCRLSRTNPCKPLDVCMVIGEPFVVFTQQHYPSLGRRITQQEAHDLLEREDTRGRVHHAFFSEMMLGRFFAICNCCSCCCSAMESHRRGTPVLASSGYVSQIDVNLCIDCEICFKYCQFGAVEAINGMVYVDEEKCMGCGVCVSKCPQEAISLRRESTKGEPLEIFNLIQDLPVKTT
jgi:Pyruvate/2-oxoacid:ferredoxin oxidoreductase delta subunit